jgi:glycosyltransferase involved in cell wall biosynthesis
VKNALISVIVPIYKVEPYIHKCIDSILDQNYHNIEIILVDDGSPDRCGEICDEYASKDSRIRVIHKENGGLSDARNAALNVFKGKYVTFIDSDDFVSKNYISYLYDLISTNEAEISFCKIKKIFGSTAKANKFSLRSNNKILILSPEDALKQSLYQRIFGNSVCGKLYIRQLFKDIRFPKGKLYEDLATIYLIYDLCQKIVFGQQPEYYYFIRPESIMTSEFTLKKMDLINVSDDLYKFVESHYPGLKKAAASRVLSTNFHVLLQMPCGLYQEEQERIIINIKKYRKTVLLDKNPRFKNRIAALLSYFGFGLLRKMRMLLK